MGSWAASCFWLTILMSVGHFPQPKNDRHVKLCVSNLRLDAARGVLTPLNLLQKWEGQVLFPPLFGSAHSVSFRSWIPYGLVSCMVSGFCMFKKSVIDNLIVFQWFLHVPDFYGSPKMSNTHDFTVFKLARFLPVLCILSLRLLALQFWFPWFLRFLCFSGFIFNFQGFPDFYGLHAFYFAAVEQLPPFEIESFHPFQIELVPWFHIESFPRFQIELFA